MRRTLCAAIFLVSLTCIASSAPVSEADLKNLLASIRQNRITQADFQEQRVIRLMKNPILSSGKVWFQPPNKFRREVKGNSPSLTVSDGRQLWIYYPALNRRSVIHWVKDRRSIPQWQRSIRH
jgi:chaperone LolA